MSEVRKAVITAAGRGTRMYPASTTVQKELFPLVDVDGCAKPTLQIIVEEAFASGIEQVCIVANPANVDAIRNHFAAPAPGLLATLAGKGWALAQADKLTEMSERISFVIQDRQEGYGHAVLQARDWVGDEPHVLMLGDHVYIGHGGQRCARQAIAAYNRLQQPISTVTGMDESVLERVGVVRAEPVAGQPGISKIEAMAEKPSLAEARAHLRSPGLPDGEYLCFFGIHVFPPEIFECLQYLVDHDVRQKNEYQLTSAQALLLDRRDTYLACRVNGDRYDMGVPEGLVETQVALALHSPFRNHAMRMLNENLNSIGTASN